MNITWKCQGCKHTQNYIWGSSLCPKCGVQMIGTVNKPESKSNGGDKK